MSEVVNVEVVYSLPRNQELVKLSLEAGATVKDAVEASGLLRKYPELEPGGKNKLGIYSKLAALDTVLRDRDRVEIYRPLIADPKTARKKRAAESGKT